MPAEKNKQTNKKSTLLLWEIKSHKTCLRWSHLLMHASRYDTFGSLSLRQDIKAEKLFEMGAQGENLRLRLIVFSYVFSRDTYLSIDVEIIW